MDDIRMPTEEPNFLDSLVPGSLNYGNMSSNVPLDNSDLVSGKVIFWSFCVKMVFAMVVMFTNDGFCFFSRLA